MKRKRMLVLCPFPYGVAAGQRLKYEQYFDQWRAKGWEINVSSFMDKKMWNVVYKSGNINAKIFGTLRGHFRRIGDLFRVPRYDLIYVFMYVTPLLTSLMERFVCLLAKRVIYDIEDNIHIQQNKFTPNSPNPLIRFLKWPGKVKFLIKAADHVITSSPFLNIDCKRITTFGSCTYVTSSVDTDRYQPKLDFSEKKTVTIGWTGTYSSKIYLDQLRDVFIRLAKRINFKLKIIGNFEYDLPGVNLEVINWNLEKEILDLQAFDIGIYPLPLDGWVDGKSGLKAIQYMALGLPCVATNVGTNPMIIKNKVNGILVKSDDEWTDALEELACDSEKRRLIGQQARQDAIDKYSLHTIGYTYDNIIKEVMDRER